MAKLISPQGTATEVPDGQVKGLLRFGWKKPGSQQSEKPPAKRGRPKKSAE